MKTLFLRISSIILLLIILSSRLITAQDYPINGSIKGKVTDRETKQPLPGVTVLLENTKSGAVTDAEGTYLIKNIKVGSYSLSFSYIGFEKAVITDVIIKPQRISYINAELKPSQVITEGVVVKAGYFNDPKGQLSGLISFSNEEIRRAPGSAGDVSRVLFSLPSVGKLNDSKNSLIVRGGSPVENGFFLDNIEIPNINHFPVQGSTDGPIGIINLDFVENVNFYSGGFSSGFGDRLSSIMDIKYREGNRTESNLQLDMSMQGIGGVIEGPFDGGNGSFMFSARRSYLDLIVKMIQASAGLPVYSDFQGKVVYDLSKNDKLSFLNVTALDNIKVEQKDAFDTKTSIYPDYKFNSTTSGLNWQHLWGIKGYSNTSLSHIYSTTKALFTQTRDEKLLMDNNSTEQQLTFRNSNHLILNAENKIDLGLDAKLFLNDYSQFYSEYQDLMGHITPALNVNKNLNTYSIGGFISYNWQPSANITISPGLRTDHYSYNNTTKVSPRISMAYNFTGKTSITATYGTYYQNIPWVIAAQKEEFKNLKNPRADHYILALNHLLTESTKLTLEAYNKDYSDFPMDPSQPGQFVFDQSAVEGLFLTHENLSGTGKANSKGIEVTVQKKLAEDFYGLIAASFSRAKYEDFDGTWHDRTFDNKFNFTIEGGYKPNESWEFSMRWIFASGAPYTPFDEVASREAHKGVLDVRLLNSSRLPDYHCLNLRADRRFNFNSSSIIVYLSLWNVYNRKNISGYQWNEIDNKATEVKMWGLVPVFGVEYAL